MSKEVEFRKRQAGNEFKHTPHSASMLERINKRKGTEVAESGSGSSADKLGQSKHRKVTEVAESGSGSSAERLGQSNLKLKESEVVESGSGSSAERLGQPKNISMGRHHGGEIQARVLQQQEQSKRRRRESIDDPKPNSELCHVEGNLQRDQAEIRRGIKGSSCKREVNAITNLLNAK